MVTAQTGREALADAAARYEPRFRRLIIASSKRLEDRIGEAELTRIIYQRDWPRFEQLLTDAYGENETVLRDTIRRAATVGADFGIRDLPFTGFTLSSQFDAVNAYAVSYAARRSAVLIRGIKADTRTSLRLLFRQAFLQGVPPDRLATTVGSYVGLLPKQAKALNNRFRLSYNELEARFQRGELTAVQFAREWDRLQRVITRQGNIMQRRRGLTVARTELMRAANEGQREMWDVAASNGLFEPSNATRVWSASVLATDECAMLNGRGVPYDREFPYGDPPIHPNCRCSVFLQIG